MKPSTYFQDRVKIFLSYLTDKALNAGIDVVSAIIVYHMAMPYSANDYQNALEAWLQGRHDVWQSRIDAYKSNPTNENLAIIAECAIYEYTPHTQCDYDDIVERAYRLAIDETLIENELEKRKNNGKR
jgi:hypothetical protein